MAENSSQIAAAARLDGFFGRLARHLKDVRKRESFALYFHGILADGERKSVEPIAARTVGEPVDVNNMHSKLLYFLGNSRWDDRAVRLEAARYAIEAMERNEPVTTWIVDDTGFMKQGKHSVGVQRQYTGTVGKVANCQVGVSLAAATDSEQVCVDFELYLPESWANDPARRAEARVPEDVTFKTKIELALDMIARAALADVPGKIILADTAYGNSSEFRHSIWSMGFDFAVAVQSQLRVVHIDHKERVLGQPNAVGVMAEWLKFRRVTWRDGTKAKLSSRFAFARVKTVTDDGIDMSERPQLWLVAEWPDEDSRPSKFVLTTLPRSMSKKEIVNILKKRWRTERMYEDLKGELGLDHFEGRSFPGWHHHVSVVLCCYAFTVAERASAFSPSAAGTGPAGPLDCAA
jgi:SRSO17 transposase